MSLAARPNLRNSWSDILRRRCGVARCSLAQTESYLHRFDDLFWVNLQGERAECDMHLWSRWTVDDSRNLGDDFTAIIQSNQCS